MSNLNVEEVFIHLDLLISGCSPELPLYGELLTARNQLLDYISRRLKCVRSISPFSSVTEPTLDNCKRLVSLINPKEDAILSFNWDVLLELALIELDKFESYAVNQLWTFGLRTHEFAQEPGPGYFLKMHGSLNWYTCTSANRPAHGRILRDRVRPMRRRFPSYSFDLMKHVG